MVRERTNCVRYTHSMCLSYPGRPFVFGRMEEPNPDVLKRAHRHQMILYGVMILFALIPFVLILWLKHHGASH